MARSQPGTMTRSRVQVEEGTLHMSIRAVILCSTFLFAASAFAREKSDVIVMKNGDRLTGEIKGLDSGVLHFSTDYIDGTCSIQWSRVDHLESKQLFVVITEDGSVYSGTLQTAGAVAGRPMHIEVSEGIERAKTIEQSQIVQVIQISDRFWQRFNGEVDSGIMYSKGNESTQYSLGSSLEYPRQRWAAGGALSSSLSSSEGSSASARNSLSTNALHLMRWNNWYYTGIANFLQSSEQNIQLQTELSAGLGRFLKNTNHAKISVRAGLAWQDTRYSQSANSQDTEKVVAAMVGTSLKFFRFKQTNLSITAVALPALSEPGRVFFDTNMTYYVKLFGKLNWNTSFYGNWDNEPPSHFSGSDYGTSSGLGLTFGNR
jgi:hypothetical protein